MTVLGMVKFELQLSQAANLGKLKKKAELADAKKDNFSNKMRELEDQVRDITFFLQLGKNRTEQWDRI